MGGGTNANVGLLASTMQLVWLLFPVELLLVGIVFGQLLGVQ